MADLARAAKVMVGWSFVSLRCKKTQVFTAKMAAQLFFFILNSRRLYGLHLKNTRTRKRRLPNSEWDDRQQNVHEGLHRVGDWGELSVS